MQPPGTPPFVEPDLASTVVFVGIVLFVATSVIAGLARMSKEWVLTVLAAAPAMAMWLGGTAALSASGIMGQDGFAVLLLVAPSLVAAVVLAASPTGRILARLPVAALVGFQAFRLPLELVLHRWYELGTVPVQLTWEGENLDVVTGVAALFLMVVGARWRLSRAVVWLFQIVGVGLLLNVIRVAFGSAPTAFRIYEEPVLLPFHVPFSWIVSVCVAGALAGHLVLFRWLLSPAQSDPSEG